MVSDTFVCLCCGSEFEEPMIIYGEREKYGNQISPDEVVSPCCRESFVRARFCDRCGELITDEFIHIFDSNEDVCSECYCHYNLGDFIDEDL